MQINQEGTKKYFKGIGPYRPILNNMIMLCNLIYRDTAVVASGDNVQQQDISSY